MPPEVPRKIIGTGQRQESLSKLHAELVDPGLGKHLWVMTGLWVVADPAKLSDPEYTQFLDTENLLTVDGPGCFKCEQHYTRQLANQWCKGRMI